MWTTKCCRIAARALLLYLFCFSADSRGCLCFVEGPCASNIAPLRCLHACAFLCAYVCMCVCVCVSALALTGSPVVILIIQYIVLIIARASLLSFCDSVLTAKSWFCIALPRVRLFLGSRPPAVPPWFLLCVQNNTTTDSLKMWHITCFKCPSVYTRKWGITPHPSSRI